MHRYVLLFSLFFTGGCSTVNYLAWESRQIVQSSGLVRTAANHRSNNWLLPAETRLYVAIPLSEELIGQQAYERLSDVILATAGRHFPYSERGRLPESFDYALNMARRRGADVLLFPQPLYWHDGLSDWTEIGRYLRAPPAQREGAGFVRDRISLNLQLIQVSTGRILDNSLLLARSGLLTLYGDTPLGILSFTMDDYFENLALHNTGRL